MAIRAPWKGWLRTAMPILSFFILLNSLVVFTLAIVNVAALEVLYDGIPPDIEKHPISTRVTLLFFWCMIPLFLFCVSIAENWSLWTDRLGATYLVFSSAGAMSLWALQLGLWGSCVGNTVASFCPSVYQHGGWGKYPDWAFSSPRGAAYAVPTIFILYIVQICFAGSVCRRQQRQSFRRSDMGQTWIRRLEDGESTSYVRLIADPLDRTKTPTVLATERPSTSDSDAGRSSQETIQPSRPRRNTITDNWLQPLEPVAARTSLSSRRNTISSLQSSTTTTTTTTTISSLSDSTLPSPQTERLSPATASERDRSHPPLSERGFRSRRSSSASRYYTDYSVAQISEAEKLHATPDSRPADEEDGCDGGAAAESRRRRSSSSFSSSGLRELGVRKSRDLLGRRGRRAEEGAGLLVK